jgi:hypothetical protein
MAGLGAFGGAGIGGALAGAGGAAAGLADDVAAAAATKGASTAAANQAAQQAAGATVATPMGAAPTLAYTALNSPAALQAATNPALGGMAGNAAKVAQETALKSAIQGGMQGDLVRGVTNAGLAQAATAPNTVSGQLSAMGRGLGEITSDPKKLMQFVKDNPYESASLAASLYNASQGQRKMPEQKKSEPLERLRYEYDPYPIGVAGTSERNYFPNARFTPTGEVYAAGGGLMSLADGGTVEQMSRMNAIGANTGYPMANQRMRGYSTPSERPISQDIIRPMDYQNIDPYTGEQKFAAGGDIESAYRDLLGRPPDAAGLAFYSNPSISKEKLIADLSYANNPERKEFLATGVPRGSTTTAGGGGTTTATTTNQAAANQAATQAASQGSSGTVNIPAGAIYVGGGYDYRGKESSTNTEAVESPFAKTTFALGSKAPTRSLQTSAATPSQVADAYERVLGRQVDLPGLEYYSRQAQMAPSTLEKTLQYSPEYFTNLAKPLVPKIVYDKSGMAMIEGGTPYNPAQYGYSGSVVPALPLPSLPATTPATTGGTGAGAGVGAGTGTGTGAATGAATGAGAGAAAGTGAGREVSTAPGAYAYNYFENKPEENALIRQFQTGPNDKARADLVELYLTKLDRLPDEAGFNYYLNTIGKDNDISKDDENLFLSNAKTELADRNALESLYREIEGRETDIPGREYWMSQIGKAGGIDPVREQIIAGLRKDIDMRNAGYNADLYSPNRMGSRITQEESAQLNAKAPFLFGTDPVTKQSNNKAREQLYKLYENNLGRTPDMGGFDYWIKEFGRDDEIDPGEREKFLARARETGEKVKMAAGGIADLGGYSDGGRLLKGPGDGVSDDIPAVIGNRQPARLADGEFVIPARIVSELGNGSTDAGARKLYAMMDRIQKARRKSVGKNRVAVNTRSEKHLPA